MCQIPFGSEKAEEEEEEDEEEEVNEKTLLAKVLPILEAGNKLLGTVNDMDVSVYRQIVKGKLFPLRSIGEEAPVQQSPNH